MPKCARTAKTVGVPSQEVQKGEKARRDAGPTVSARNRMRAKRPRVHKDQKDRSHWAKKPERRCAKPSVSRRTAKQRQTGHPVPRPMSLKSAVVRGRNVKEGPSRTSRWTAFLPRRTCHSRPNAERSVLLGTSMTLKERFDWTGTPWRLWSGGDEAARRPHGPLSCCCGSHGGKHASVTWHRPSIHKKDLCSTCHRCCRAMSISKGMAHALVSGCRNLAGDGCREDPSIGDKPKRVKGSRAVEMEDCS